MSETAINSEISQDLRIEILKESVGILNANNVDECPRASADPRYTEIILDGAPLISGKKTVQLTVKRTTSQLGKKTGLPTRERFVFYAGEEDVLKEISVPTSKSGLTKSKSHIAGREELMDLYKTIKGSKPIRIGSPPPQFPKI